MKRNAVEVLYGQKRTNHHLSELEMTGTDGSERSGAIASSLGKVLSQHGHGFHYAVMRRAEQLSREQRSNWVMEVAEYPVSVRGAVTHIDFVFRSIHRRTYLVAECKRADPAKARWCFIRAPYTWRNNYENEVIFEGIQYGPPDVQQAITHYEYSLGPSYHIGLELKTDLPGDGVNSRPAINEASAQVLRGTNGLINSLFASLQNPSSQPGAARFLPVIFTTAELWVTDANLSEADLRSGKITIDQVKRAEWLWFTHNQSPELQHGIDRKERPDSISKALRMEYARTIAIVSPDGIDSFLCADLGI